MAEPPPAYMSRMRWNVSEHVVQLLWRNGLYNRTGLETTNKTELEVIKPGRLNKTAGPDFKNAVIILKKNRIVGDVEIHINAAGWYQHDHHLSPLYDRTILHVFLQRSEKTRPAVTRKGRVVPELELGLYLRHPVEELKKELENAEVPITGRADEPPCKAFLLKHGMEWTGRLLDKIGEGRVLIKSGRMMERMKAAAADQALYEIFFECLGYSQFRERFSHIARAITLTKLREIIHANRSNPPYLTAQSVFFRVSGLYETASRISEDGKLNEMLAALDKTDCRQLKNLFVTNDWRLASCRPLNYPHRRIAAFSHLIAGRFGVDYFRKLVNALPLTADLRSGRRGVRKLLDMFTGISDAFWDSRYTFNKTSRLPQKLIGKDRAISLLVDCFIPFFLAISRAENKVELENKLSALYYSLPKPSSNAIIDFMARNILGGRTWSPIKTIRHQQALIQLYNDFCFRAPSGCVDCVFLKFMTDSTATIGQPNR